MNSLKKFLYIGAFLFVLAFPVKVHANITTLGFSEYGIKKISIPEGYAAITRNDLFNAEKVSPEGGYKVDEVRAKVLDSNEFLDLLPYSADSIIYIYFYEEEAPYYREDREYMPEEAYTEKYLWAPEGSDNITLSRGEIGGKYCLQKEWHQINNNNYRYLIAFHTTVGDKCYEILFEQVILGRERNKEEAAVLYQVVENAVVTESTIAKLNLEPVPDVIDFPEFGIYNVKIPEGFSVFTPGKDYMTTAFCSRYRDQLDSIHEIFETESFRLARIINDDFTYEIDIRAYPTSKYDTIIQETDMPDSLFEKTYRANGFPDDAANVIFSKGTYYGKYGTEGSCYRKEQDYYYHRFYFSNAISENYYNIYYTLNGYHVAISKEAEAIFQDNLENMTLEGMLKPDEKPSLLRRILNFFFAFMGK